MKKTFSIFSLLIFLLSQNNLLSNTLPSTKHADSLFMIGEKKIALYEYSLINDTKKLNKHELLKASIIAEQNQNTPLQLLFLNKLYLKTNQESIQEKIEAICEEKNISGHSFSDIHWLTTWFTIYKSKAILICLLSICLLLIYYTFIFLTKKRTTTSYLIPLIIVLTILLVLNNIKPKFQKAIVTSKNTSIKKQNSGISSTIHNLKPGDAVYIHHQNTIWTKISIDDYIGYIRTNTLTNI